MNHKRAFMLAAIVGIVAIGLVACASGPRGRGGGTRELGLQDLLAELSLFVPQSDLKGYAGATGGPGMGPQDGQDRQDGAATFTRDESLNLTADQITQVLSILTKLKNGGDLSSKSIAQTQKDIEALLTAAQKKEFADFKAAMEKSMNEAPPGQGGPGGQAPGGGPGAQGSGGPGGQPPMNGPTVQQIQSELDSFIAALEDYQKKAAD